MRLESKSQSQKLESFASQKLIELLEGKSKKVLLIRQPLHEMWWFFTKEKVIEFGYGSGKLETYDSGYFKIIRWTENNKFKDSAGNDSIISILMLDFFGKKISGRYTVLRFYTSDKDVHYLMFKNV